MGESAGAMAVYAHVGLPRSRGLFQQAIAMSGNDFSLTLEQASYPAHSHVECVHPALFVAALLLQLLQISWLQPTNHGQTLLTLPLN